MHECTHYLLGRETNLLLESLAQRISIKWDKPLGQTTGWLRTRLSSHKSLLAWFSHQVKKRSWNRRWCRAASRAVKILFLKNLFPYNKHLFHSNFSMYCLLLNPLQLRLCTQNGLMSSFINRLCATHANQLSCQNNT